MGDKFKIPSCVGIPDSMWEISTNSIYQIKQICLKALVIVIILKFLTEGINDTIDGQLSLKKPIKIISMLLLSIIALMHYEQFIMYMDKIITNVFNIEISKSELRTVEIKETSLLKFPKILIKMLLNNIARYFFLFYHKGAIMLMYYFRSVILIITAHFGPISIIFSFLPGPLKSSFKTWLKSYLYVSCWAITLKILTAISRALTEIPLNNEGSELSYNLLSFVFFFIIFLTPALTSKFFGFASYANLGGTIATGISISRDPINLISKARKSMKKK